MEEFLVFLLLHMAALYLVPAHAEFQLQPAAQTIKATQFTDDEKAKMGSLSAGMVSQSLSQTPPDQPLYKNHAGAFMKGLQAIPAPKTTATDRNKIRPGYDPNILGSPEACPRDYSAACPEGYNYVGDTKGDGSIICAPGSNYEGPCVGSILDVTKLSIISKKLWATRCLANWPCKVCTRDFGRQCPQDWKPKRDSFTECEATYDYRGPCGGSAMDFIGFNGEMKRRWSSKCAAWWPCAEGQAADEQGPDPQLPITRDATTWRILKGYQ